MDSMKPGERGAGDTLAQDAAQPPLLGRTLLSPKALVKLFKLTWQEWTDDNGASLSAGLAYYTVFSIAPALVIAVAVAGLVFGQQAARGELTQQISGFVGKEGADLMQTMLANASKPYTGSLAALLGLLTLLFGATGAFGEIQSSLNHIWNVPRKKASGAWSWVTTRFVSFVLVLSIGLLLLVMLILSTLFLAPANILGSAGISIHLWGQVINFVASFVLTALAFALIYKALPDVDIAWRDVWLAAIVTSVLFTIGKQLIGVYLGQASTTSTYGAAGSLVIVMLWVYCSAQILFLGAEFTQVFARLCGSRSRERAMVAEKETTRADSGGARGGQAIEPVAVQASAQQVQSLRRLQAGRAGRQPHRFLTRRHVWRKLPSIRM